MNFRQWILFLFLLLLVILGAYNVKKKMEQSNQSKTPQEIMDSTDNEQYYSPFED